MFLLNSKTPDSPAPTLTNPPTASFRRQDGTVHGRLPSHRRSSPSRGTTEMPGHSATPATGGENRILPPRPGPRWGMLTGAQLRRRHTQTP